MNTFQLERRRMLKHSVIALALLSTGSLLARNGTARASGGGSKEDFHYQEQPNEGKRCAGCKAFIASPTPDGAGQCAIVAGPINPNGWCMAFSPT